MVICYYLIFCFSSSSVNTKICNYPDSNEEIVIGNFCGKHLYRKRIWNKEEVIHGTAVDISALNLDTFVGFFGGGYNANLVYFPFGYCDEAHNELQCLIFGNSVHLVAATNGGATTMYNLTLYIEYTKTTD